MNWDKLIATVYSEQDFGRSIATTVGGIVGLTAYLLGSDWVVALFSAVIAFPVVRVIASGLHCRWKRKHTALIEQLHAEGKFHKFSSEERQVIEFFVRAGGACVSWSFVNNSQYAFPRPALNSLMLRGIVCCSVMEDGMSESFELDIDIFDIAQRVLGKNTGITPVDEVDSEVDSGIPF